MTLLASAQVLAAAAELREPERTPGEVRNAIDEVLSREEFRERALTWVERLQRAAIDLLERGLGALLGGGRAALIAWVILAASVLGIGAAVARFSRGVTRDPGRSIGHAGPPRRGAADWRAEAEAAERAGQWSMAMRCRYRALVAELADRGLVEEVAGRTAGEYRVQVAGAVPSVAAQFTGATELFEVAWYGHEPAAEADVVRLRELAGEVLSGAGR